MKASFLQSVGTCQQGSDFEIQMCLQQSALELEEQSVRYIQVFKQRGRSAGELGAGPEYETGDEELGTTGEDSCPGEEIGATVADTGYELVKDGTMLLP